MLIDTEVFPTTAIRIPLGGGVWLDADLNFPPHAEGLVLFAHGSGSSRHSRRNRYVASELNALRLGTVLADLLTLEEERLDERSGELRFDIPMLSDRVAHVIDWAGSYGPSTPPSIGLFGASTGAAAALDAAAARAGVVAAVVSRGGRPDLASRLPEVKAPTLLLVGGRDPLVLEMNAAAHDQLRCIRKLEVVPHATHLFEEPGTLEAVARSAGAWFQQYLRPPERTRR